MSLRPDLPLVVDPEERFAMSKGELLETSITDTCNLTRHSYTSFRVLAGDEREVPLSETKASQGRPDDVQCISRSIQTDRA